MPHTEAVEEARHYVEEAIKELRTQKGNIGDEKITIIDRDKTNTVFFLKGRCSLYQYNIVIICIFFCSSI